MPWKRGPMPSGTYGWGGVVPVGFPNQYGFFFADFTGDTVIAIGAGGKGQPRTLQRDEVAFYNNDIQLPIRVDDEDCCPQISGRAEV